jgi:predicted HD phosphohydrolase
VNQLEHALQCAALAEEAGADAALITAAVLYDIGHLVHDLGCEPAARGIDDRHELRGSEWLSSRFGTDVTEPVRLHVAAKRYPYRYRCGLYFATLSPGSARSLALQGGPFTAELAAGFFGLPHAPAAVQLRRWDEGAKSPGKQTPGFEHFRPYLEASLLAS